MGKRQTIELGRALVHVEERPGYLFIVESGRLGGVGDVRRYQREVDRIVGASGLRRALIDARGEVGDAPQEVREAMWDWLVDPERGFDVAAFVLASEIAVTRVNMIALSRGANLRAFDSVSSAQRWLARGGRPSSTTTPRASSRPPSGPPSSLPPTAAGAAPTERPGRYRASAPRVERIGRRADDD